MTNNSVKKETVNIDGIIKSYGQNIRSLITSFTGNKNFQDIQQEVYVKIWKNLPRYKDHGNMQGWIKKITVNTCKDHLRSKQFNQEKVTALGEDNFTNIKDRRITPDNRALLNERQKRIIDAIENLKPKYKEVIIFYDIEEMTYEEIAGKLNCPVGTVKSRLFNARKQLQNELTDLLN